MSTFVWRRTHTLAAAVVVAAMVGGGVALATGGSGPAPQAASTPSASPSGAVSPSPTPSPTPPPTPTPKPKPTDPLTGGAVSQAEVIAVKIENIAPARPQLGLGRADIVFVEQVEARLTRLVAVYHTDFPSRVGPVRSARSTDAELLPLFGKPGLLYSGANRRVQAKIDAASIVPLQRSTRDSSRVAPHNVVVDLKKLAGSASVGRARSIGWTFAARDARWDAAPAARSVKGKVGADTMGFAYAKGRYTVTWNGRTYADPAGGVAKADTVVMMSVHDHADGNADVNGSASVKSDTVGRGKVTLYRDGKRLTGTWHRSKATGPLRFTDSTGRDIPLRPGKTWVLLQG